MERTGILIMLTKVKACANLLVPLIGVVVSVLLMGCSSKNPKKLMPLLLLILALIHTMMQDMIRVRRMGIMMVSRIYKAILTTMLADIRERKGRNMSWGMKKGYDAGFDDGFADSDYDSEEEELRLYMIVAFETIIMAANINFFLLIVPLYITFSKLLAKKFCCFE